jgi:glycosyltransferase involved in cell wall biosynthesis
MKITHIIGYFQPELGYEEYYTALTQYKLGHDVSVITSDRIYPFKNIEKILKDIGSEYSGRKRWVGMKEVNGLKVYRLPCVIETLLDFIIIIGVGQTLSKIKPDVVHCHGAKQGTQVFSALNKGQGYKLVVDEHDQGPTYSSEPTLKNNIAGFEYFILRRRICRYIYKKADALVAITPQTKKFLMDLYKIPEDQIELLTLGVNTDMFFFNESKRQDIRNKLGIKGDQLLLITTGRLIKEKKTEILIKAFGNLSKKYKIKLLIIGRGDEDHMADLKNIAAKVDPKGNIIFQGFAPPSELPYYYSAADIGIWGKESITIIEAMACGLPLVIADMDTMKHLASYENGLTFQPGDQSELESCLEKIISDKALRNNMRKNSINAAKNRYSYDVRTKKLLNIYERVLNE